jgi:hypothetical protein
MSRIESNITHLANKVEEVHDDFQEFQDDFQEFQKQSAIEDVTQNGRIDSLEKQIIEDKERRSSIIKWVGGVVAPIVVAAILYIAHLIK